MGRSMRREPCWRCGVATSARTAGHATVMGMTVGYGLAPIAPLTPARSRAACRSGRGRRTAARRPPPIAANSQNDAAAAAGSARSATTSTLPSDTVSSQKPMIVDFIRRGRLAVGELEPGDRDHHLAHREQEVGEQLPAEPDACPAPLAIDGAPGSARSTTNASDASTMPTVIRRSGVSGEARGARRSDTGRLPANGISSITSTGLADWICDGSTLKSPHSVRSIVSRLQDPRRRLLVEQRPEHADHEEDAGDAQHGDRSLDGRRAEARARGRPERRRAGWRSQRAERDRA